MSERLVPLTDAELGLIITLVQENVVHGEGSVYEIVVSGERATAEDLLTKLINLKVQGG